MKNILLLLFSGYSISFYAQQHGIVVDQDTKQPIPYASIWCITGNCGTSANEQGRFTLSGYTPTTPIAITSVGYHRKELAVEQLTDSVFLVKDVIVLDPVAVQKFDTSKLKLGKLKNSPDEICVANDYNNRIVGKFFTGESYNNQPMRLEKVRIKTFAELKTSQFNLQVYSLTEKNQPGSLIYTENIVVPVKRGTHTTEVDLTSYGIVVPENGFFVAFENLLLEQNRLELFYFLPDQLLPKSLYIYEPRFKIIPNDGIYDSFYFNGVKWILKDTGSTLSMQVILSK
ncbi:MAG: hypothetical protein RLZZ500_583 [Bacteroidota bacterium]|jgi:hypothetical protein